MGRHQQKEYEHTGRGISERGRRRTKASLKRLHFFNLNH
jgi:hypothetical protein